MKNHPENFKATGSGKIHAWAVMAPCILFFSVFESVALGQKPVPNLANDPRYVQASRALDEGIPQVSIQKLNECLASKLSAEDKALAVVQLAKAFLSAGRAGDALKTLNALSKSSVEISFLKAQAFTALGKWEDACPIYHELASQKDAPVSYKISEAECLHELGKQHEAIQILESISGDRDAGTAVRLRLAEFYIEDNQVEKCEAMYDAAHPVTSTETKWKKYVGGRLLLARRRYEQALAAFTETLKTREGLSDNLLVGATLGIADARLALSGPETADNVIEDFIWQNPDITGLSILFRRLDQIYAREKAPSESELQKWAEKTPPAKCSTLAVYYLARAYARAQKFDKALATLDIFIAANPSRPLVAEAQMLQGDILSTLKRNPAAIAAYEAATRHATSWELLAEAEMAAATAHFKQREFTLAQGLFESAARHSERLWQRATFNSALSWLNQANYDKFLDDYKELSLRFPESEFRSELLLEEGLLQARSGDSRAETTLQRFLRDFPRHPRAAEARLALSEIVFLSPDQNLGAANRYLKVANETPRTADTRERAEYLAIFLADSAEKRDEEKVIQLCQEFIKNYPSSPLLADVRMKLGQVFFRRPDFPAAETQFELLARDMPASPFAEAALFLAAQSSLQMMNTDHAVELFEQIAKLNGPLKLYARQQEAILKGRLGSEQDAIFLYDSILDAKPDTDLKFAALCGKGDNTFLLGGKDAKFFDKAIMVYNDLANQPEATAYWHNQALYKKGKCLEKLGKQNEALAAFYDVIQPQGDRNGGPEYLWFYRAGFDAAHILESQEQWKPAIAIYQKMAALDGPRSEEAKARLTQLRLEHFIWEE